MCSLMVHKPSTVRFIEMQICRYVEPKQTFPSSAVARVYGIEALGMVLIAMLAYSLAGQADGFCRRATCAWCNGVGARNVCCLCFN